jgi:hypothetical protein
MSASYRPNPRFFRPLAGIELSPLGLSLVSNVDAFRQGSNLSERC